MIGQETRRADVLTARAQWWSGWCLDHEGDTPGLWHIRLLLDAVVDHLKGERLSGPRADVLIAEARERLAVSRLGLSAMREMDRDIIVIRKLADALEAATGGQHIESKHWAEVGRLRARVAELETELAETKAVDIEEYRHLLAVIERAKRAPYHGVIAGGLRQDSVYTILDSIKTEGSF